MMATWASMDLATKTQKINLAQIQNKATPEPALRILPLAADVAHEAYSHIYEATTVSPRAIVTCINKRLQKGLKGFAFLPPHEFPETQQNLVLSLLRTMLVAMATKPKEPALKPSQLQHLQKRTSLTNGVLFLCKGKERRMGMKVA